jgi:hypothetical protein
VKCSFRYFRKEPKRTFGKDNIITASLRYFESRSEDEQRFPPFSEGRQPISEFPLERPIENGGQKGVKFGGGFGLEPLYFLKEI